MTDASHTPRRAQSPRKSPAEQRRDAFLNTIIPCLQDLGFESWSQDERKALRSTIALLLGDFNERSKEKEETQEHLDAAQKRLSRRLNIVVVVATVGMLLSSIFSGIVVAHFFPNTVYVTVPATPTPLPTPTISP